MFQTFEASTRPEDGPARLADLRVELEKRELDGFLVPRSDAWQGEYVSKHDERLSWLTGFTGSAGFCIVLPHIAGVFNDGRYRVQIKGQVDLKHFTPVNWPEVQPGPWLKEQLSGGGVIGYDPWLHTPKEIGDLERSLSGTAVKLVPVATNPVDAIWADQPAPACGKIALQPLEYAGESAEDKLARIAAVLKAAGQSACVITLPDSISWLLNIRGSDIPKNPVVQAFAILDANGSLDLFIDPAKIDGVELPKKVRLHAPDSFAMALRGLEGPVRVDPASAPVQVMTELKHGGFSGKGISVAHAEDPILLPKARKNAAEIAATTEAHLRDGAAMCEFLCWLDAEAPKGHLTEIAVVKQLESYRRATNALKDISFDTICGAGPNGAMNHYRVTNDRDRPVKPGELLLVDSGGQYQDGTTDITRTIAVGDIGDEEKRAFTLVLQGMIAVSRLRWPKGRAGRDLEAVARYPLWLNGWDYDHGTGHGVGAYLSVHEGPARLSRVSDVPIEPGMILSNEPGYYREGGWGIRIENLIVTIPAPDIPGQDAREMLAFDTITWVPIDRRLIVTSLLSPDERAWIDSYHTTTADKIGPRLSGPAKDWLIAATLPL